MTLNEIQWSKEVQALMNEDALPTHSTCHVGGRMVQSQGSIEIERPRARRPREISQTPARMLLRHFGIGIYARQAVSWQISGG